MVVSHFRYLNPNLIQFNIFSHQLWTNLPSSPSCTISSSTLFQLLILLLPFILLTSAIMAAQFIMPIIVTNASRYVCMLHLKSVLKSFELLKQIIEVYIYIYIYIYKYIYITIIIIIIIIIIINCFYCYYY